MGKLRWAFAGLAILVVVFLPLSVLFMIPAGRWWCEWRNEGEFERHRARYEGIVQAISKLTISRGTTISLSIAADKDPASLRVLDREKDTALYSRENEVNVVGATRMDDGRLVVRICTHSLGHAGLYGLFYSSGPPGRREVETSFGVAGRTTLVGPGWWAVADYSQ